MDKSTRSYRNYINRMRRRDPAVRQKEKEYLDNYCKEHPEYVEKKRECARRYYHRTRDVRIQIVNQYNCRSCKDPVVGDVCRYNTLIRRKSRHPDLYEGVTPAECLVKVPTIKGMDNELKKEYGML